ncbi:Hsp20/alpha crystallin family protein [Paraburkholderia bengalensis]|uniref:Hsp20/alpha crystallin family protein n=1 Tax=Paraburkholderia bengalensis TaxID=2747562 RepID=A0ABU8J1X1_9BURK
MDTDLQKWNPFRFLRKDRTDRNDKAKPSDTSGPPSERTDIARLVHADPWRIMQGFFNDPYAGFGALDRWFGDFTPARFQPHIDVVDEGDALRVTAELPGIEREDLHMTIENGALVLRGEKKQDVRSEEQGCYRLERAYGAFLRTIPLPEDVDLDKVDARFDKGVLNIRVPRTDSARSTVRKIEIR